MEYFAIIAIILFPFIFWGLIIFLVWKVGKTVFRVLSGQFASQQRTGDLEYVYPHPVDSRQTLDRQYVPDSPHFPSTPTDVAPVSEVFEKPSQYSRILASAIKGIRGDEPANGVDERIKRFVAYCHHLPEMKRFYSLDKIPEHRIASTIRYLNIKDSDPIIALFDDSVPASNREGVAFTASGVYWKNIFRTSNFISWDIIKELSNKNLIEFGWYSCRFSNVGSIDTLMTNYKKSDFESVLKNLIKIS